MLAIVFTDYCTLYCFSVDSVLDIGYCKVLWAAVRTCAV